MTLDPNKVTHIVWHTAATPNKSVDISAAAIDAYHKSKGWNGIGYHAVARQTGVLEEGRPLNRMGAHVEGFNACSVGICLSGNGDLMPPTPEQFKTAVGWTVDMLLHFDLLEEFKANPMRVIGHREINDLVRAGVSRAPLTTKTCPGTKVDMAKVRRAVLVEVQRRGL
jgi:N-acetylmuramoyl-L-alanine amidase